MSSITSSINTFAYHIHRYCFQIISPAYFRKEIYKSSMKVYRNIVATNHALDHVSPHINTGTQAIVLKIIKIIRNGSFPLYDRWAHNLWAPAMLLFLQKQTLGKHHTVQLYVGKQIKQHFARQFVFDICMVCICYFQQFLLRLSDFLHQQQMERQLGAWSYLGPFLYTDRNRNDKGRKTESSTYLYPKSK
ncbi:hypothetical protein AGLY_004619 [Aphis glycines]|uniref:Uncharacterized protein n=1 Tax=Aphis glycines TaxID=307491 RepID=A0A6G0TVB2_APHGL|nr:hypothetical protein AGLY_004619 [Aphis glycines]